MNYISDLREGDNISGVYLCKSKIVAKTKAGKTYYSLQLQDRTGIIDAKIWELSNAIEHFESMNYIQITAIVTSFNSSLQLNVSRVRVASENEYDPKDYMPCTNKDVATMYRELMSLISKVSNTYLRALLDSFFINDKEFAKRFVNHSAAKSIHHGFIGGLLEHTLSVAKLCEYIATNYPAINHDLLVTAAMFHDVGKVNELSAFPENDYTDEGQLIGHIVMGTIMLDERIKTIEGFPTVLANELKHCILAHHGELEYGSPKKPALIEAMALSMADNMDAKMQTFTELISANKEGNEWFGYNRMFESNVRRTND